MTEAFGEGSGEIEIRDARREEFEALGRLTAEAYAQLPRMPGPDALPGYYAELRAVAERAAQPSVAVLVAAEPSGALWGGVTFIGQMKYYGAEPASRVADAAGIRMLAVDPRARGRGLGRALTEACIARARALDRAEVVLHTTDVMQIARGLYERMGFRRSPDLDFGPGGFTVLGFRLRLRGA